MRGPRLLGPFLNKVEGPQHFLIWSKKWRNPRIPSPSGDYIPEIYPSFKMKDDIELGFFLIIFFMQISDSIFDWYRCQKYFKFGILYTELWCLCRVLLWSLSRKSGGLVGHIFWNIAKALSVMSLARSVFTTYANDTCLLFASWSYFWILGFIY